MGGSPKRQVICPQCTPGDASPWVVQEVWRGSDLGAVDRSGLNRARWALPACARSDRRLRHGRPWRPRASRLPPGRKRTGLPFAGPWSPVGPPARVAAPRKVWGRRAAGRPRTSCDALCAAEARVWCAEPPTPGGCSRSRPGGRSPPAGAGPTRPGLSTTGPGRGSRPALERHPRAAGPLGPHLRCAAACAAGWRAITPPGPRRAWHAKGRAPRTEQRRKP